jgi:hypothetical protein
MRIRALIGVAIFVAAPALVRAGDVTFTENFVANFQFDVLGGTPINSGIATGFVPYQAVGALTFTLDSSVDDPSATTVPITDVTGMLTGDFPGSSTPFTISPDVQFLSGDLTNITHDGSGHITSADVTDLSMRWDLVAYSGALVLYTLDGLPFNGTVSSVPFSYGDVISGPDQFNVYTKVNGSDLLVAYGDDRTLTAVPEPVSAILAGLAVVGLGAALWRRREPRVPERQERGL